MFRAAELPGHLLEERRGICRIRCASAGACVEVDEVVVRRLVWVMC